MNEKSVKKNINEMSLKDLRIYCNQIIDENSDLKKQIFQMNKTIDLLNSNKLLSFLEVIKSNANFAIESIESFNSNKDKNSKPEEDNNRSDESLFEDINGFDDEEESFGDIPDKYLEQNIDEFETNQDMEWKPSLEVVKTSESKASTTGAKRSKYVIYNPPERVLKTVKIGGQEYGCLQSDDGLYHCEFPDCNKMCSLRGNLLRHYTTHGAEKRFKCHYPECVREFADNTSLNIHLLVHSGEKPFACEWTACRFRTNNKKALKIHNRIHTGEKPSVCEWPGCQKRFMSSSNLRTHMKTHTGERNHKCNQCNYSSITSSALKQHQRTHYQEYKNRLTQNNVNFGL